MKRVDMQGIGKGKCCSVAVVLQWGATHVLRLAERVHGNVLQCCGENL